jgi:hypothetical protein
MSPSARQPWIWSATIDGVFILGPGIGATLAALLIVGSGHAQTGVSLWAWAMLIIGVDVAHVYSTVYRTYFDPVERRGLSAWLLYTPLVTWLVGVLLYSWSAGVFWSALAYTAVFHFVRQQYGFMMLYSRAEKTLPAWTQRIDQLAIYGATLFPLLYWHTHLPRPFTWFMDGDFIRLPTSVWSVALPLYGLLFAIYVSKELWLIAALRYLNIPRNAVVLGTALSWYVGIVIAAGDLVFTLTNVVAHGVPYIALTCIFARRRDQRLRHPRSMFIARYLPITMGLLIAFAFIEEGLWDGLVWREHLALFPGFRLLPRLDRPTILTLIVPLLAVPQMTHYVIDGVIWRLRTHPEWRTTLFWSPKMRAL